MRAKKRKQQTEESEKPLTSILDVSFYKDSEGVYYHVGVAQDKLIYSSNIAVLIRKVESLPKSDLVFDELLPLMNVMLVRNGQLKRI